MPGPYAPILTLEDIRNAMNARPPRLLESNGHRSAAVAMILREETSTPHLLFIERARCDSDPWSGDLGFPGGKIEESDPCSQEAAIRETLEEIGLDLNGALSLGQLDDIAGDHLPVKISCFLFYIEEDAPFTLNEEVTRAFWIPLPILRDPARHIETLVHFGGKPLTRPAIDLLGPGETVLWGITYRLVRQFLDRLEASSFSWPYQGRTEVR
jgi:8-oxo-dGTP pyrophosphatase MutT (NUDIX family)